MRKRKYEKEDKILLEGVITAEMCKGVLNEITSLIPVVFPTMISFIAVRKGISFVSNILHSA